MRACSNNSHCCHIGTAMRLAMATAAGNPGMCLHICKHAYQTSDCKAQHSPVGHWSDVWSGPSTLRVQTGALRCVCVVRPIHTTCTDRCFEVCVWSGPSTLPVLTGALRGVVRTIHTTCTDRCFEVCVWSGPSTLHVLTGALRCVVRTCLLYTSPSPRD